MARTGRRPAGTDTRGDILDAARRQFTANGYSGATIRGIAGDAGVDPALVHHYFGAKDELFVAALDIPVNPAAVIPQLAQDGVDGLGERIVATMLTLWDAADINPLLMLLRSVASGDLEAAMMRDFFAHTIMAPLRTMLDVSDVELRATLAASQFVGLLLVRYVVRMPPLATMTPEEIGRIAGPNVQRYLTGDLDA